MLEKILSFFTSETLENIILILKPISFLVIFIFVYVIIFALRRSIWLRQYFTEDTKEFLRGGSTGAEEIVKKNWKKIKERLKSKEESDWKLAVLEGEEVINEVLYEMGYQGEDISIQLKKASEAYIPQLKALLKASKIYQDIIGDPDYVLSQKEAEEVVAIFEEFLKAFEYI